MPCSDLDVLETRGEAIGLDRHDRGTRLAVLERETAVRTGRRGGRVGAPDIVSEHGLGTLHGLTGGVDDAAAKRQAAFEDDHALGVAQARPPPR